MATHKKAAKKPTKRVAAVRKKAAPARKVANRKVAPAAARKPVKSKLKDRARPESLRLRTMMASFTSDDIAQSLRFYRDGLGFVIKEKWIDNGKLVGYHLKAGSIELGIGQDDGAKGRNRVKGAGSRLYCETTQSVDAIAARLRGAGFPLVEEPADHSWGVRAFTADDPDGFRISIFQKIAK